MWSIYKDITGKENNWRQRPIHTQHHHPFVWKVKFKTLINLNGESIRPSHLLNTPLFCLGCLRWRVSCLRTKTWKSLCMTMTSWAVMRRSARQWLTWRTASCPDITRTVACHKHTACKYRKRRKISNYNIVLMSLSTQFSSCLSSGINQWRDQLKPSQILENLARMKGLSKPRTEDNGNSLTFNGKDYTLAQFGNVNGLIQSLLLYLKIQILINDSLDRTYLCLDIW